MSENENKNKNIDRNIPGMLNRSTRFAEVEHAQHAGKTVKRILKYFAKEKGFVLAMLFVVIFGTLCGIFAPSLQSTAIDIIAGEQEGNFISTLIMMAAVYGV